LHCSLEKGTWKRGRIYLTGLVDGSHRRVLLGIAQLIMLGELAVNRALDNLDVAADTAG